MTQSSIEKLKDLIRNTPNIHNSLYEQTRQKLLQALNERVWDPGEKIPPEPLLASILGISVGTLRRAVSDLVADGVLVRRQGSGTFVATYQTAYWNRFLPFQQRDGRPVKNLKRQPILFESGVIEPEAARKLSLAPDTMLIHIIRHMFNEDDELLGIDEIYLEKARFKGFTKSMFLKKLDSDQSLYAFYEKYFNALVVTANNVVRIETISKAQAERLLYPNFEATIVFEYERVSKTFGHVPIEYRTIRVDHRLLQIAFDL